MNEDRLREIYAGLMTSRGAKSGGRIAVCPAPETLLALVRREGSEEERLATLDHVMSCLDCRKEFDLLRSIEVAGAEAGAGARPGRRKWALPVALAASALLAVVIGRFALPTAPESEVLRSGPDAGVTLVAPPREVATGAPIVFAWHPITGATRYRLEVLTDDGTVALEAETADTSITLQGAADLAAGDYQWWVAATSAGISARSTLRPLRLTSQ
ncbi:MAG TPA: hypothetical protein VH680_15745 [Gemmatimonadales bacterium]|jgi:hypothetical protein